MKVVIVDDSAAMRRMEQRMLESMGWSVVTAANGVEALAVLEQQTGIQLLLTDWHMPEMDGLELVRQVRRQDRYSAMRVIMVTSESVVEAVQSALDAGADDFVMKPFSSEALSERISDVMNGA